MDLTTENATDAARAAIRGAAWLHLVKEKRCLKDERMGRLVDEIVSRMMLGLSVEAGSDTASFSFEAIISSVLSGHSGKN